MTPPGVLQVALDGAFTGLRQARESFTPALAAREVGVVTNVATGIAADSAPIHTRTVSTVPPYISSGLYKRSIAPGEIVVILSHVRNAGMLWQAQSGFGFRLAGGFINSGFSAHSDQPQVVRDLERPTPAHVARFEAYIKASGVRAIWLDLRNAPFWTRIFREIGFASHREGQVEIFRTDGCRTCRSLTQAQIDQAR